MPLLYYWRPDNYWRDLDRGAGFHLNQASPRLHGIDRGDHVWAFTRAPGGEYVLAADLVVRAKTRNPKDFVYGPYRVWGDLRASTYYALAGQPGVEGVIRALSLRPTAARLGQAFQGHAAVRTITPEDHGLLAAAAVGLRPEPRAQLVPEEQFERVQVVGERAAERSSPLDGGGGMAPERRQYLVGAIPRAAKLAARLRSLYEGRCQLCEWSSRARYDEELCEGHHLH